MASKPKEGLKSRIKRLFYTVVEPPPPPANVPQMRRDWSIGIYVGNSPLAFAPAENIDNPVLTREHVSDVPAGFVADPFMIQVDHRWYMFFEVWNRQTQKGEIGFATSENGFLWAYQQIALAEPFHLSYPYVFQWKNEWYMVPESLQVNSIRLYRATNFPREWSFVKTLVEGRDYVDSSPVFLNDRWWLFTGLGPPPYRANSMCLYYADELTGRWREHRKSPIVKENAHIARPAGRVLMFDGRVIRYAQDCEPGYGLQVRAFEITDLTTRRYHEREVNESPVLKASGVGWNASGMHHIDPHLLDDGRWIACVDGQIAFMA